MTEIPLSLEILILTVKQVRVTELLKGRQEHIYHVCCARLIESVWFLNVLSTF